MIQAFTFEVHPLMFPARRNQTRRFMCAPRHVDPNGLRRLLLAVLVDAVRVASNPNDTEERSEARAWLLEAGAAWAQAIGYNLRRHNVESWAAAGWPRYNPTERKRPELAEKEKISSC